MKIQVLIFLLFASVSLSAQSFKLGGLDYHFKPTTHVPFYITATEKTDSGYRRLAYFYPGEKLGAIEVFADEAATIPISHSYTFYENGKTKSEGKYLNGKKTGSWLGYHENGMPSDSCFYMDGLKVGIELKWNSEGYLVDSIVRTTDRNVLHLRWYGTGEVRSQERYFRDSIPAGTWHYFYKNGNKMGEQKYENGKLSSSVCYDKEGNPEKNCDNAEADFKGGSAKWVNFLASRLNPDVPVKKNAPAGKYTVLIKFVVNPDGSLSDFRALTNFSYGMEEEAIRTLKTSPKWLPAKFLGSPTNAYRIQPVTFAVNR